MAGRDGSAPAGSCALFLPRFGKIISRLELLHGLGARQIGGEIFRDELGGSFLDPALPEALLQFRGDGGVLLGFGSLARKQAAGGKSDGEGGDQKQEGALRHGRDGRRLGCGFSDREGIFLV